VDTGIELLKLFHFARQLLSGLEFVFMHAARTHKEII